MGGFGSGTWYRFSKKNTIEDYCSLDINYLVKQGYLKSDIFNMGGSLKWWSTWMDEKQARSSISFNIRTLPDEAPYFQAIYSNTDTKEKFDYKIFLTTTWPNYGGKRWWFICPINRCRKRVRKLYLTATYFACRKCLNLAYNSQSEPIHSRMLSKARKIHVKLGGSGCIDDEVCKPKGMHQKTFNRLIEKMEYYDQCSLIFAVKKFL